MKQGIGEKNLPLVFFVVNHKMASEEKK